jgi:hypothetical protein
MLDQLSEKLNLTDTQKAQIAPILEDAKPKMKAIYDEARARRKALIESVSGQITPILTPEQQTKFEELVKQFEAGPGPEARKRLHERFGGSTPGTTGTAGTATEAGRGGGGPEVVVQRLTAKLGLSAEQQGQVKSILDSAHEQVQATRQDPTLTQDQKFAKVRETMQGAQTQINALLTPAQQQQFAEMRQAWHKGPGRPGAPAASPSVPASQ